PRPLGHSLNWLESWRGRGPDVLLRLLGERLAGNGGVLCRGARARELVMSEGRCVGVEATVDGAPVRFAASAVVVADGGFQANRDMLETHIGPFARDVQQRNTETAVGDGIRMAQAAGADVTRMDRFYGHVLSR